MEQEARRGPGRPPTGMAKPKRNVRIGDVWDECGQLARQLDPDATMTEVVDRALTAEKRRMQRALRQRDEVAS